MGDTLTATLKRVANAAASGDAEIIALSAEVLRLNAIGDFISEKRIAPFDDQFMALLDLPKQRP